MPRMQICLMLVLLAVLADTAYGDAAHPLFSSVEAAPLSIELIGPLRTIARDSEPEPESRPGTLVLLDTDERFAVELKPRGKSRRDPSTCRFPPLWIKMKKSAIGDSIFAGHHRRKLVTHCDALTSRNRDHSKVWIEMLAYRALNLLTDRSFRVQPLAITYRDSNKPEVTYEHPGFLIEHKRELARRLDLRTVKQERVRRAALEPVHANLVALFNLLIGNTDFSLAEGPPDDNCCHNSVPLFDAEGVAFPIIYDFDSTGLVNPRYASPSEAMGIRSVKTRKYRGYCRHNAELAENLKLMVSKRAAIEALFSESPGIKRAEKNRIARYLRQFYESYTVAPAQLARLQRTCFG